ncbi:MAG TPA: hypothetical protein VLV89_05175 [Candidatus Acidoferrum sp.]|nr:hypothetical protein [Candidatus Acidoferrum sp.]
MASSRNVFARIIFWTYERGTVPYDIAVAAIVLFVLLTPRSWFRDRPQMEPTKQEAGIVQVLDDEKAGTQTFNVDPRLLALPMPKTELEHQLHDAIRKNVHDLQGRPFQIVKTEVVLDKDGQVVRFIVTIKP